MRGQEEIVEGGNGLDTASLGKLASIHVPPQDAPMPAPDKPPLYTVLTEIVGWTLDRTADLPKSSRFTFGQRIDNRTLDALELTVRATFSAPARKRAMLEDLNLLLEQLRVLWRLCNDRGWISQQQLVFVVGKLDEAGRMTGGWLKQLSTRPDPPARNL